MASFPVLFERFLQCYYCIMAISLASALEITRQGNFDISFVSYDSNRKTGGELIELTGCRRTGASHNMREHDTISVLKDGYTHPHIVHTFLIKEVNKLEVFI